MYTITRLEPSVKYTLKMMWFDALLWDVTVHRGDAQIGQVASVERLNDIHILFDVSCSNDKAS